MPSHPILIYLAPLDSSRLVWWVEPNGGLGSKEPAPTPLSPAQSQPRVTIATRDVTCRNPEQWEAAGYREIPSSPPECVFGCPIRRGHLKAHKATASARGYWELSRTLPNWLGRPHSKERRGPAFLKYIDSESDALSSRSSDLSSLLLGSIASCRTLY